MEAYKLIISFFLLVAGCGPQSEALAIEKAEETLHYVSSICSSAVEMSRNSSVKIVSFDSQGNKITGSGAYLKFRGKHFILTATHVVEESQKALIVHGNEEVIAEVVYSSKRSDISVLKIEGLFTRKPLAWRTSLASIGEPTVYTGFPNSHDSLSIRGAISGFTEDSIIMHSYAWSGASGSVVLDRQGRIIGVVSAIDVGTGFFGAPQIVEDIVLVAPITSISIQDVLESLD